jgi:hypothetical protein
LGTLAGVVLLSRAPNRNCPCALVGAVVRPNANGEAAALPKLLPKPNPVGVRPNSESEGGDLEAGRFCWEELDEGGGVENKESALARDVEPALSPVRVLNVTGPPFVEVDCVV